MYPASPALRQLFQLSPLLLLPGFAQHLLGQLTNYALSPATDGTECLNIIRSCLETKTWFESYGRVSYVTDGDQVMATVDDTEPYRRLTWRLFRR